MASPHHNNFKEPPKALTFDVFGTRREKPQWSESNLSVGLEGDFITSSFISSFAKPKFNWRKTVVDTLIERATIKLSSDSNLIASARHEASKLSHEDWAAFAQEWRRSYKKFTTGFIPGESEWRDIDTHHHLALVDLLKKWKLEGLYTDDEVKDLSLIWHFLDPWSDSSSGLHKLGTKFITSTLSNGNQSLLQDLNRHGDLGFRKLQSSADFKAYKPHPSVYAGAAKTLGFQPGEVAMVAAHLTDLKAARESGFRTVYVERSEEEDWGVDSEEYKDAKTWVDMWVALNEDGFIEVARRFDIE